MESSQLMIKLVEYLKDHATREWKTYEADVDAEYDEVFEIDLSSLKANSFISSFTR